MGYAEILRKSWRGTHWNKSLANDPVAQRAAYLRDHYGKHTPISHGFNVGDTVTHTPSGATGTVVHAPDTGWILLNHGGNKGLEEYHHTELKRG